MAVEQAEMKGAGQMCCRTIRFLDAKCCSICFSKINFECDIVAGVECHIVLDFARPSVHGQCKDQVTHSECLRSSFGLYFLRKLIRSRVRLSLGFSINWN